MASWLRVAAGLQMVAEEVAKQATAKAATIGIRSTQHGFEVVSSAHQAAAVVAAATTSALADNPQAQAAMSATISNLQSYYGQQSNPGVVHRPEPRLSSHADESLASSHPLSSRSTTDAPSQREVHFDSISPSQSSQFTESTSQVIGQSASSVARTIPPTANTDRVTVTSNPSQTSESKIHDSRQVSLQSNTAQQHQQSHLTHLEDVPLQHMNEGRPVPSTRIGRAAGFAQLGMGLAFGTAVEGLSRLLGTSSTSGGSTSAAVSSSSIVVNDANSDRLASSLCRMRGAALKMGQMLSIQDESLLPPALQRALKQVRQGAEAMPKYQLMKQLETQLGKGWRDRFVSFDELPFAAASIGQVHRAQIQRAGSERVQDVVVKVQYPGVGRSIESDLRNLSMLVKWTGLAPKGLFLDNVIRVGQQELSVECDYRRELLNQRRIRQLVEADPILRENRFVVPEVIDEVSTDEILTSEYRPGGTIDKVSHLSQEERNRIARTIMYLTMKELFVWRFMQTDPNWGNFLYDVGTCTTSLIDFGATREYSKDFVDGYLRIVWASANRDEAALMEQSYRMNFLTGSENDAMVRAHQLSGYTVGEPFFSDEPFDFRGSNISTRMGEHTSIFLKHRLTPPPEEVYTLHRKLAGAYMLCIKLGAVIRCRDMLQDIVANHEFDDGLEPLVV